jgi:acyl-CoA thioester hydrolase
MYIKNMTIKDEHIDFQGILDGLHYPYYMEETRHQYIKEALGVDIVEAAKRGQNYVLASYELNFRLSLKKGDEINVTCKCIQIQGSKSKFGFEQEILIHGKVAATASFIATCLPAAGGRPYIPEEVKNYLSKTS